jgi:flagellar hook-length control protein FliK
LPQAGAAPDASVAANVPPAQLADPAPAAGQADAAPAAQAATTTAAPGQQVSAALVSLAGTPGGGQRMTLRLEPAELGQVQIRIDRPQDGPAQVEITVQRPETLTLLLRDQPQLEHALDQAGVPAEGRSLTLHIAQSESAASSGGAGSGTATGAGFGQDGGSGAGTRSGQQGNPGDTADQDQDDTPAPLARWLRAGLDITA